LKKATPRLASFLVGGNEAAPQVSQAAEESGDFGLAQQRYVQALLKKPGMGAPAVLARAPSNLAAVRSPYGPI
jgi:hypothetical protein